MSFSFRQIAWAAFVIAFILLIFIGVAAYRTTNSLVASEKSVAHTHEVQALLEDLRADIIGTEYARRGYTITNDEMLLKNYRSGLRDIPLEMERLRQATADNPARKANFDELQSLIDGNLTLQEGSVELRRRGRPNLKQEIAITQQTAKMADQTRGIIGAVENDEDRLLVERQAAAENQYKRTLHVLGIAFLFVLVLLGAEFSLLNVEFTRHGRTEQAAQRSRELVNAFFSSSTVGFAILDSELRCRRVNDVLAGMAGVPPDSLAGKPIHDIFGEKERTDAVFRDVIRSGQAILDHEISTKKPFGESGVRNWLVNYFPIRDPHNEVIRVGVIAVDVTERRNAERAVRGLSARFLNLQDQERRRIARELHDSLGQYLAGLKITIEMMRNPAFQKKEQLISECSEVLERCISETRTISHLLHPPLLDEAGFASAARWFVTGFSQRSGVPVTLDLPDELPRMPDAIELALFRVLQESLTNIHRHSESKSAEIRLQASSEEVALEIIDHGRGIPVGRLRQIQRDGTQAGVGLAGMRERVCELGGSFEIQSNGEGTTVLAAIPLFHKSGQAAAS